MEGCDRLITDHLWLAARITKAHVTKYHVPWDDTEQDARVGLIKAARKFDPARGVKFATFATQYVHGAIVDGMRATSRISRTDILRVQQLTRCEEQLSERLGRQPTGAEVMHVTDWTRAEYDYVCAAREFPVSLSQPVDGTEFTMVDMIPDRDEDVYERALNRIVLDQLMSGLYGPERFVMLTRAWGMSTVETGELMGTSPTRVSQHASSAMKRMTAAYRRQPTTR